MSTAVIAFDFDPLVRIGDSAVRWETVAVAASIFAALVLAAVMARGVAVRRDDLLFVVLGIVPGAVVGGRIGYVLLHPAWFGESPGRILDPANGSLELTLAVVGGALSGAIVGGLLDGRPGRWVQLGALPFLVVAGLGKLAMVLGGSGQGQPTTGEPATAYLGSGPWGSLAPALPSIPSQALEGIATAVLLVVVIAARQLPPLRRADGRLFLVALAGWSIVRFCAAATWRDAVVVGPFRTEQLIDIAVLVGSGLLLVAVVLRGRASGEPELTPDRDPAAPSPDRLSA